MTNRSEDLPQFIPSHLDTLVGGRIEMVEVKEQFDSDRDLHYTLKLQHARAIYAALGWSFRLIERHQIEAEPTFTSVEEVQAQSRAVITAADVLAVQRLLEHSGVARLEEIEALFPPDRPAFAIVCAMTVRRITALDLSGGLHTDTPVRLVSNGIASWAA